LDLQKKRIDIDHQLQGTHTKGYSLGPPKSKKGYRSIPMTPNVLQSIKKLLSRRNVKIEPIIDGRTGFLFINSSGIIFSANSFNNSLKRLVKDFNAQSLTIKIPMFSAHHLRHTFCTNMIEAGMKPTTLQYIAGHSNITVTLDIYTHVTADSAAEAMAEAVALFG